jgi:hypothetical protein
MMQIGNDEGRYIIAGFILVARGVYAHVRGLASSKRGLSLGTCNAGEVPVGW